jgi:hypothetical protein
MWPGLNSASMPRYSRRLAPFFQGRAWLQCLCMAMGAFSLPWGAQRCSLISGGADSKIAIYDLQGPKGERIEPLCTVDRYDVITVQ